MIRGVQSALAVRRQRSLRVQPPGGRRGSQFNSTSSLAGSERRHSVLSTKVSNSSVTMFHIGIVFIILGTILIITSLIPGHVRTDQWDDLFGTGCFLFLIGGGLGLINRMVAKGEDEKLNSYVQRKLARSKSGLPASRHDDDAEGAYGARHHHQHGRHGHNAKGKNHHKGSSSQQGNKNGAKSPGNNKKRPSSSIPTSTSKQLSSPTNNGDEDRAITSSNNGSAARSPAAGSSNEATLTKSSPSQQTLHPIIEEQQSSSSHHQQPKISVQVVNEDDSALLLASAASEEKKAPLSSPIRDDIVGVHQVRVEEIKPSSSPTADTPLLTADVVASGKDGSSDVEDDEDTPLTASSKFKLPRQKSTS